MKSRLVSIAFAAVSTLVVACSASPGEPGEGTGQSEDALGRVGGGNTPPPPGSINKGQGPVCGDSAGTLASDPSDPSYPFQVGLLQFGCDPTKYLIVPERTKSWFATDCPEGVAATMFCPATGTTTPMYIGQYVACYANHSPEYASFSMLNGQYVNPCSIQPDGKLWVDFDPTCTGPSCRSASR